MSNTAKIYDHIVVCDKCFLDVTGIPAEGAVLCDDRGFAEDSITGFYVLFGDIIAFANLVRPFPNEHGQWSLESLTYGGLTTTGFFVRGQPDELPDGKE